MSKQKGSTTVLSLNARSIPIVAAAFLAVAASYFLSVSPAQAQDSGDAVVSEARSWSGTPYLDNGGGNGGVDCSDLTSLVYGASGVSLPDDPNALVGYGYPVSTPGAGDLVFFSEDGSGSITHVGIATGVGTIVHSSTYFGAVTETPIADIPGHAGARRVL